MMLRTLPFLLSWLLMGLSGGSVAAAPPVEEIRQLLASRLVPAPSGEALSALNPDTLPWALESLDPHARFIAAVDYRAPLLGRDAWTGIGADLVLQGGQILLDVYQGGAADRVGVPDRARLLAIEDTPVDGLTPQEVATRLRGEAGTQVRVRLALPDGQPAVATITREAFTPLAVELVAPGEQRVLRVRDFVSGMTRPALLATIEFLGRGQPGGQPPLVVIDLRDALGGDLYEAFDLAGLFVPEGTLLGTLEGREGARREVRAPAGRKFDMPLALLVGPDTASAAEVFAGALQKQGRAVLVGSTTYGKCSSQTDARLSDGSVLRFTNLEVMLPDGASCSAQGLLPDVAVDERTLNSLPALLARAGEGVAAQRRRPQVH